MASPILLDRFEPSPLRFASFAGPPSDEVRPSLSSSVEHRPRHRAPPQSPPDEPHRACANAVPLPLTAGEAMGKDSFCMLQEIIYAVATSDRFLFDTFSLWFLMLQHRILEKLCNNVANATCYHFEQMLNETWCTYCGGNFISQNQMS